MDVGIRFLGRKNVLSRLHDVLGTLTGNRRPDFTPTQSPFTARRGFRPKGKLVWNPRMGATWMGSALHDRSILGSDRRCGVYYMYQAAVK
jgi:hypothetical protein